MLYTHIVHNQHTAVSEPLSVKIMLLLRAVTKNKIILALLFCSVCAFIIQWSDKIVLVEFEKINEIKELVKEIKTIVQQVPKEKNKTETESNHIPLMSWMPSSTQVRLWMEIPNAFPWRYCIQEYNGVLTLLDCNQVQYTANGIDKYNVINSMPDCNQVQYTVLYS